MTGRYEAVPEKSYTGTVESATAIGQEDFGFVKVLLSEASCVMHRHKRIYSAWYEGRKPEPGETGKVELYRLLRHTGPGTHYKPVFRPDTEPAKEKQDE
jgi:hypothetical protein